MSTARLRGDRPHHANATNPTSDEPDGNTPGVLRGANGDYPTTRRRQRRPQGWVWSLGSILENATDPMPETGCRLWSGATTAAGYGTLSLGGRTVYAHRLLLAWSYGYELDEVPTRVVTRHQCGNRRCVEPDHLLAGWAISNVADAIRDGHMPWTFADGRCQRGHDVSDPATVYVHPDNGRRGCRACRQDSNRQFRSRSKAEQ